MNAPHDGRRSVVAGFEPFDGRRQNRSWEVVRRIPARAGLETLQLPVDYAKLKDLMVPLAGRDLQCLLLVGESPCDAVSVEQVALNAVDCDCADESGRKPDDETLVAGAPLALRARWDARSVARQIRYCGVPATASFHAGTFACNAALFLALHTSDHRTSVGFLHVPYRRWPLGIRMAGLLRTIEVCLEALGGAVQHRASADCSEPRRLASMDHIDAAPNSR
jgi:pyroglutamyl-peptidase